MVKIDKHPGMTGFAAREVALTDCTSQWGDSENLHVLPCGILPPNPLVFLSSDGFKRALKEIANQYEYLVLDGPPLLAISDALVIAHLVDVVILTIKAEETTIRTEKQALRRLNSARITPLGAVLTQVDVSRMTSHYGDAYYHYDYRYT